MEVVYSEPDLGLNGKAKNTLCRHSHLGRVVCLGKHIKMLFRRCSKILVQQRFIISGE